MFLIVLFSEEYCSPGFEKYIQQKCTFIDMADESKDDDTSTLLKLNVNI